MQQSFFISKLLAIPQAGCQCLPSEPAPPPQSTAKILLAMSLLQAININSNQGIDHLILCIWLCLLIRVGFRAEQSIGTRGGI